MRTRRNAPSRNPAPSSLRTWASQSCQTSEIGSLEQAHRRGCLAWDNHGRRLGRDLLTFLPPPQRHQSQNLSSRDPIAEDRAKAPAISNQTHNARAAREVEGRQLEKSRERRDSCGVDDEQRRERERAMSAGILFAFVGRGRTVWADHQANMTFQNPQKTAAQMLAKLTVRQDLRPESLF